MPRTAVLLIAAMVAGIAAAPAAAGHGGAARHALRSAVTDGSFYFVMADRFENGDPANDLGGLPAGKEEGQFDPTPQAGPGTTAAT